MASPTTQVYGNSAVRSNRPVICSDCGEVIARGDGVSEPSYGVSENCRRLRGIRAMKDRRLVNKIFNPDSTYRRTKR